MTYAFELLLCSTHDPQQAYLGVVRDQVLRAISGFDRSWQVVALLVAFERLVLLFRG